MLVVVHTPELHVLLLERADYPGHWQSVTGSREDGEALPDTAARELFEETGIVAAEHGAVVDWKLSNRYEIYLRWRSRYAPGITRNTEHVFSLLVGTEVPVTLAPREHSSYRWWPWQEAATRCFSPSNRDAILALPARFAQPPTP